MKKYLAFALALCMLFTLVACGGSKTETPSQSDAPAQKPASSANTGSDNPVSGVFKTAISAENSACVTITVSSELKLEEDAWLGLCPVGKDYVTEEEADDVDVIWYGYEWREENDPYIFSCDFSDVEDGTYALVVATSDNADVGYVIIQLKMTKKGDKLSFDFDGAKLNKHSETAQSAKPVSEETPDGGDPAEYSREYWESKYPGENICPFYIEENGIEYSYYWVSGFEGWEGTIESWLDQPFNWNGWHKADDGSIVNEDETLKITDNWANGDEAMSSFCTVTTELYIAGSSESGTAANVSHNVPDVHSFKTQEDLTCKENFIFSGVYKGSEEDKENDSLFFDFFNEDALYCIFTGFNEDDGELNHIWGYARLFHFYDDADAYYAALEEVPSYLLKEQNDEGLYFTTGNVRDPGAESYSEFMDMFANQETDGGEFDNFEPYID